MGANQTEAPFAISKILVCGSSEEFCTMALSFCRIFFVIAILITTQRVSCILRCYSCTSYESWKDCNSKQELEKTECPRESPNCIRGVVTCANSDGSNDKQTIYYKGCGAQGDSCVAEKESTPSCEETLQASFDNTCCDGDYCNSGSAIKISTAIIAIFIFYVLWGFLV